MTTWVRRIRAAVGLALLWALGGLAVGGAIELVDNVAPAAHPFTRVVDMWPQTLALLAFPRGLLFAVVLGLVGRRRRFEAFTLAEFAAWGTLAGLVVGIPSLGAGVGFLVVTTLLSAVAGVASLALARAAATQRWLGAGPSGAATELPPPDAAHVLDRRG